MKKEMTILTYTVSFKTIEVKQNSFEIVPYDIS